VLPNAIIREDELPTWTEWLAGYANAVGYSVRHIQRVILNEPREKFVKECGWSISDHNRLLRAATLSHDLVNAIEAGADTVALVTEVKEIFTDVSQDVWDRPFQLKKRCMPKRSAKKAS